MIIPMPIFMPSGNSEPIMMPNWLAVFGTIVVIAFFIGVIALLIHTMLSLVFDIEAEWLFKIAGCVCLLSAVALLVFVILILFFGETA